MQLCMLHTHEASPAQGAESFRGPYGLEEKALTSLPRQELGPQTPMATGARNQKHAQVQCLMPVIPALMEAKGLALSSRLECSGTIIAHGSLELLASSNPSTLTSRIASLQILWIGLDENERVRPPHSYSSIISLGSDTFPDLPFSNGSFHLLHPLTSFFFETITHAGVQCHNLGSLQPLPPGFK
ncbi:hypothetical protein AAY473_034998 [Plecturocebus cupreus]